MEQLVDWELMMLMRVELLWRKLCSEAIASTTRSVTPPFYARFSGPQTVVVLILHPFDINYPTRRIYYQLAKVLFYTESVRIIVNVKLGLVIT